jgi:hypothetical protein
MLLQLLLLLTTLFCACNEAHIVIICYHTFLVRKWPNLQLTGVCLDGQLTYFNACLLDHSLQRFLLVERTISEDQKTANKPRDAVMYKFQCPVNR